jgi:hypothetical protein
MTNRDKPKLPWTPEDDEVLDRLIENFRRTDLGWPVNLALPDDPRDLVKPGTEVSKTPGDPKFSVATRIAEG